jgi:uncharacterized membrane protein HdeD (DUF308 family)
MVETLSRYWWAVALRGAAALIFGVVALIWPHITLLVLVALFGVYALVDGVSALASAFGGRGRAGSRGWLIVEGIVGILAGIFAFAWPGVTTLVLLWFIGFWAIVTGVIEIMEAVRLRREIRGEWLLILAGALSVLFGILLFALPATGALALVFLIGWYAIVFGVTYLALGFRLRRMRGGATAAGAGRPATA